MSSSRASCSHALSQTLYESGEVSLFSAANAVQEKLNEAVMVMNRSLQDVNIQNMNVQLVAQMFKNYQSNVLFHLEGRSDL